MQKLCYHPGWRLMRLGYRTCFPTLYDEKKYIYAKREKRGDRYINRLSKKKKDQ